MNLVPTNFTAEAAAFPDIAASSPALDLSVGIVVCIPAFRRPQHLRLTLESLARQRTARRFAVVVVENDTVRRESLPVAAEFLVSAKLEGLCVIEPAQGNCRAINAAFGTALAMFPMASSFLMIDDDEIASPDWLELMVAASEASGADVIGGPVRPVFDDDGKRWLARHPAFRPVHDTSGPVPVIYGCGNCLITRGVFARLANPTFDLHFNFLGGGDTDFFWRCRIAGMRFHWVEKAVITETVPQGRTNIGWLVWRGLRIGAINFHVQYKAAPTTRSRAAVLARMLARLPLSLVRTARLMLTEKAVIALHPAAVAVGGACAAVGIELEPYKASKIAS
jgi:GT2 family glycosyltransferase